MQECIFIRVHAAFDGEAFEASDRKCLGQNHSVQICTNAMSCNETSTIAEQEKKMGQRIKVLCDENSIAKSPFLALKFTHFRCLSYLRQAQQPCVHTCGCNMV